MDEQAIKELIAAEIGKALGDVEKLLQPIADKVTESLQTYLDQSIAPLEERLDAVETAPAPAAEEPAATPEGEPNPLEARLAELEKQLAAAAEAQAAKEKEAFSLRFGSALDAAIDTYQPNQKPILKELLEKRFSGEVKETKKGLLIGGKTLEESVKTFFDTPEGQYFLPSDVTPGTGVRQPSKARPAGGEDLETALLTHFGG